MSCHFKCDKTLSFIYLFRKYWWAINVSFRTTPDCFCYSHLLVGHLMKNLTGTFLDKILLCFYLCQVCTDKGHISFGMWIIEQTCLWLLSSNAASNKVWKLYLSIESGRSFNRSSQQTSTWWTFIVWQAYTMLLSLKAQCPAIMWC